MFIKRKTKVLIRTFTVRRDLPIFGLFSRILENDNFDVRITSLANVYTNCKYWKPDVVVVNSLAGILKIRKAYSATKIVFYQRGYLELYTQKCTFKTANSDITET